MADAQKKKKPYRSLASNAVWSYRGLLRSAPSAFWLMVLRVPFAVALAYLSIYLPARVVREVTADAAFARAALAVGGLIAAMLVCTVVLDWIRHLLGPQRDLYRKDILRDLTYKSSSCFYQNFETKQMRDLLSRATRAIEMWNGVLPVMDVPQRTVNLIENGICYALFGTVLSFVSPWLIPILTVTPLVNWVCERAWQKWEYRHRRERSAIERPLGYIEDAAGDFAAAKDIRIYGLGAWLCRLYQDLSDERLVWQKKLDIRRFLAHAADLLTIMLRDGAAYALLIALAVRGEVTADEFVLYFAAISSFATTLGKLVAEWTGAHTASLRLCDLREYLDYPEADGTGTAKADDHMAAAPEITFDRVSFRYDNADTDTLHNVSFVIRPGERLALVGLNGAGKTTLVKLLTGLYLPTSGDILINGVSVRSFARKDYYRLFSPVFQEIRTAFFSLAETVSCRFDGSADLARAEECMRRAGLGDKLDSLPQGIHTRLDKQVHADGTELSGGEAQRLMLARALYKDAPILVLDEPTAALDPLAEHRIYTEYQRMCAGKSALFISHRLASTRFCDRILYLKDGAVAEEGTHEALIAQNGEYAGLYEMQSCWYREDREEADA